MVRLCKNSLIYDSTGIFKPNVVLWEYICTKCSYRGDENAVYCRKRVDFHKDLKKKKIQ